MFKLFTFACIIAFAAAEAKPGLFGTPFAYDARLTYPSNYIYGNQYAYSGYAPGYYNNYYSPIAYNYGSYYYR